MTDIQELASKLLKKAESLGVGYADVRASLVNSTSFMLHNGKFESPMVAGESFGVGVRVIHKGKMGFYSTNDERRVGDAVKLALKLARTNPSKEKVKLAAMDPVIDEYSVAAKKPLSKVSVDRKVKLARDLTAAGQSDSIRAVDIRYVDGMGDGIFASSEGTKIIRHGGRTVVWANVTSKSGARLEQTGARYGGFGFEKYDKCLSDFKKKAKLAVDLLKARLPKAGVFDAVMDNEAAGVFAHEAVGHACEADAVLANASVLKGKLDKKIGDATVNITDSPTITGEWGAYGYDDEGVPAQYTELIVGGVLKSYLHTRATASEFKASSTGNARAQGYNYAPIVRMSNTFFEGGDYSNADLIKEVKNGYLLEGFHGGTVEPLAGDFTFACEAAREIKNGRLGVLLKGCTFGGTILETLHNVFGCGAYDKTMGIGWCGKMGQSVPAGDGACHVGVRKLHIGGEE